MLSKRILLNTLALASCFSLLACGGGGSSPTAPPVSVVPTPTPTPTPTPAPGSTWTSGVYEAASLFKSKCETPRSGVDIQGNVFPDTQGARFDEKMYLRSWTDETYLWFDEVADRNPNQSETAQQYFSFLKTNEILASGKPKDDFHFELDTARVLELRTSAATAGYGVQYGSTEVAGKITQYFVVYNEPNSPASEEINGQVQLPRGSFIVGADGVRIDGSSANPPSQAEMNTFFDALQPRTSGETHTLIVRDAGATDTREVTIVSEDVAEAAVNRYSVISTPTGNVGYILLNTFGTFEAEAEIAEAFDDLAAQSVTDLIVDLRYNGGGFIDIASQMSYSIAGDNNTAGKDFTRTNFNSKSGNLDPVTGRVNVPTPFHSSTLGFSSLPTNTPLSSLNLSRVYVLGTERTCSASELLINSLRGIDVEVFLFGPEPTCGKPFGFYSQDNCGTTYFSIQMQSVNAKGFGSYEHGFVADNYQSPDVFGDFAVEVPGCEITDDFSNELGDNQEAMLQAALHYRENNVCPTASVSSSESNNDEFQKTLSSKIASQIELLKSDEEELIDNAMVLNGVR